MRIFLALCFVLTSQVFSQENDADGDGLSDFQELHKYLTDPKKADSDGDGIPDGDWKERREYQYTVRSIVQVMRPVSPEFINDDYQDARILNESRAMVELEVIHYPYNRVARAIKGDLNWREPNPKMKTWLKPGPTADWTPQLRAEIMAFLNSGDLDLKTCDDRQLCELAAKKLLARAKYESGFTTFLTAFDAQGKPFIPANLRAHAQARTSGKGRTFQAQFDREMSAKGMFENMSRGSCTSSAIYLNGCLRAIGIPSRIIYCIPLIDRSDSHEVEMVRRGITHKRLRKDLLSTFNENQKSWTSHTFNEVYIGGRWRRLNYSKLGDDTLDSALGLMTHIATFNDWADAEAWKTIGTRQMASDKKDIFGFRNPYSCVALSDHFGAHSQIKNLAIEKDKATILALYTHNSKRLPTDIRSNLIQKKRYGLIAEMGQFNHFKAVMRQADRNLEFRTKKKTIAKLQFAKWCFWVKGDRAYVWIPMKADAEESLKAMQDLEIRPNNQSKAAEWLVSKGLKRIID